MNKKGFIFIETVVTVVVLSTSLLLLYSSYSNTIYKEKDKIYYDDLAYIYRTNYIKKFLIENSNIENIKKNDKNASSFFDTTYIVTIGTGFDNMFTSEQIKMKESLDNIYANFNINQMILMKSDILNDCEDLQKPNCKNSYENISFGMANYIRSLNPEYSEYFLVVEYTEKVEARNIKKCTPASGSSCSSFYTSLGI